MGGRRWGLRCRCHLADTKQFICPCGIKLGGEERTSHAREREEQGQRGVKKKVWNKLGGKKYQVGSGNTRDAPEQGDAGVLRGGGAVNWVGGSAVRQSPSAPPKSQPFKPPT